MISDDFLWDHYFENESEQDNYYEEESLRDKYYELKQSYQDENKNSTRNN